ncbi:D-glycero-beta-D-manno-heptose 1-phosphate adenylyltransferase [bacterium]|nr:D-glycero-beta-D-manno-heptose 1-phosphate adenylyltransferase [bacterium]
MTLLTLDEAIKIREDLRKQGKKVVVTNGCFDIIHVGHVRYLQQTKSYGDVLIVLLNSDSSVKKIKGDDRPLNNENDRAEILSALSCVDYVVKFSETSVNNLLEALKPDIYTKGADYTLETLPERDTVKKLNIEVKFIDFVKGKSTTNLIEKIKN